MCIAVHARLGDKLLEIRVTYLILYSAVFLRSAVFLYIAVFLYTAGVPVHCGVSVKCGVRVQRDVSLQCGAKGFGAKKKGRITCSCRGEFTFIDEKLDHFLQFYSSSKGS